MSSLNPTPVVEGFRHVGIVVADLPRALLFYRDLLGLEVFLEREEIGSFIDTVTGLTNVHMKWSKLKTPDGIVIELIQYFSHPDKMRGLQKSYKLGCSHIAFRVNNLDEVYVSLSQEGISFKGKPSISPDGIAKVVYCHDPEGNIIELVQILSSNTP